MPWLVLCRLERLPGVVAGTGGLVRAALASAGHAIAHILWVLVLVKLVTPPLVSVPLSESPGRVACSWALCSCEHHSQMQAFVRDTLPWVLLAIWSTGAGTTAWTAWRRWARFRNDCWHTPARRRRNGKRWLRTLAAELSLRRPPEILAVPGRLPPLVVPGTVPAAAAAADGLAGSARCLAAGRPAAARAGPYQARRPPGAAARADGGRGLLVVASRRLDRPAVARLRGSLLRRGRGGPSAGSAARLRPVAPGCDRFRQPLTRASHPPGHRDECRQ